jgi:hypothetical protein
MKKSGSSLWVGHHLRILKNGPILQEMEFRYVCKLCINSDENTFVVCLIPLHNSALVITNKHLPILSTVSSFNDVGLQKKASILNKKQVFSINNLTDL